jgi:XTP/dITP diphosphohydrolase
MDHLHFATTNNGKFVFLQKMLSEYGITLEQVPLALPEPRSDDLKEIAREKVLFAFSQLKRPCIALDAGFYVHSLNGFPGAFSNFALRTVGVDGILKLAEGKPKSCEFRNCLAYMDSSLAEPEFFFFGVSGILSDSKRGRLSQHDWSEFSYIFIPEGKTETLAEMNPKEREDWVKLRHMGSGLSEFSSWLSKR